MAIRQLGKVNFADLARYLWKSATDFLNFQNYLLNRNAEEINSLRTVGVIYGGAVTAGTGLSVNISAGAALFSNGEYVTWDAQTLNLAAADPSNPRISRVELAYALNNNLSVTNIDNQSKTFDFIHVATATENAGTAAASPAAPAKTSGRVCLGEVTVGAGATNIVSANIDQTEDTSRDISAVIVTPNYYIRGNATKGAIEVSYDAGVTWSPVSRNSIQQQKFTLANNQASAAAVTALVFDKTKVDSARILYSVYRKTDSAEVRATGELYAQYKPVLNQWDLTDLPNAFSGDDRGVEFSIDASTGQINYTSTNLAGSNYSGTMRFEAKTLAQ